MNVGEVQSYCQSFGGVFVDDRPAPSNILTYKVGEKNFAYFKTSNPEKWRFSFRTTPERFLELTDQPGIKPARYMHRFHWVSVVNVEDMNERYLRELIKWSYQKSLLSLSKKAQKLISSSV